MSGVDPAEIGELIHGSTTAINTLIERKGAKTGLIVTRGTRDVYSIGRGNPPRILQSFLPPAPPARPRQLTREVGERVLASGEVLEPCKALASKAPAGGSRKKRWKRSPSGFLHSYANPEHERAAGEIVRRTLPDAYVSLSHEILREYREFERTSTTVVNAYVGPKVAGYVRSLKASLAGIAFARARHHAVERRRDDARGRDRASGGDDGVRAGRRNHRFRANGMRAGLRQRDLLRHGRHHGQGEPDTRRRAHDGAGLLRRRVRERPPGDGAGDRPGRGGGGRRQHRLDRRDRALKVGPQSAGADPGPICYRGGGTEPTITDANLVLGRLDPDDFLGGQMALDAESAARGILEKIAGPLAMSTTAAAQAIVDIAVAKMSLAVREVSVAKGYDPRDFRPGRLGRRGAFARDGDRARAAHTQGDRAALPRAFLGARHARGRRAPTISSAPSTPISTVPISGSSNGRWRRWRRSPPSASKKGAERRIHLDLRYVGQEFTLSVPVTQKQIRAQDRRAIRGAFDRLYERRYAHHSPEEPVEIVNIRLAAIGKRATLALPRLSARRRAPGSWKDEGASGRSGASGILSGIPARRPRGRGADLRAPPWCASTERPRCFSGATPAASPARASS